MTATALFPDSQLTTTARILVIGGLAESLINFRWPLIRTLAERGHQVFGCAAEDHPEVSARFSEIGGAYYQIPLRRAGMNPRDDWRTYSALRKLIRTLRVNVVIAYTIKPVVYGMLAAHRCGVARRYALITGLGYAFTDASSDPRRAMTQRIATLLYKTSLKKANHIFFQNPDDQELFIDRALLSREASTSIVNGSGVDTRRFRVEPLPAKPVFLLIARLLRDKGIREYVEAARIIRQRYPEAVFLLAGPVDPNPAAIRPEELRSWVNDGSIEYLGPLADVRPAIARASVYVLPSYREGTPRTVLEAMAMGRPIITTNVPGCRETVQHGINGLLVPHKNVPQLAEAMEQLIIAPELRARYAGKSREIAESKYDDIQVSSTMIDTMNLNASAAPI
ncbi:glycosyltransferase family 4 protein [Pigmentiphaga soli]|uniref:Glycosyltransferase family 4 protein n=1 Tax=Pigmentiphaga soli TaxID=1007095 RepID=A0ABP8H308_9BURK